MTKKRKYIAKNIREGWKASEMAARHNLIGKAAPFKVRISTHSHGRDLYGNGTAHYICELVTACGATFDIVSSGYRSEQVGYGGMNEAALYALHELGYEVDTSKHGSYDYHGAAEYPLINFTVKQD